MPNQVYETRYQVFVSSTFIDLKNEREKVLQALLENKAFPAGMELFPAADDEQFEFIKREIDSSDYYIVIVAGRYGSVASDGISYTEKEYDYAVQQGKPILSFIYKDIMDLTGAKLEATEDGKNKLTAFRGKVGSRRLAAFYENPDDLKAKVFHAIVQAFNQKPRRGWVRAGQTSREDLQRISALQEKILLLEAENKDLRARTNDSTILLASGTQEVTFDLEINDMFSNNVIPFEKRFTANSNWDEMLTMAFPGGTSYVKSGDLRRAILKWILEIMPHEAASDQWWAGRPVLEGTHRDTPRFSAVEKIRVALHRQFTGLGLIAESRETIYIPNPHSNSPTPHTETSWRLTDKGERHLARIRGFLADVP